MEARPSLSGSVPRVPSIAEEFETQISKRVRAKKALFIVVLILKDEKTQKEIELQLGNSKLIFERSTRRGQLRKFMIYVTFWACL